MSPIEREHDLGSVDEIPPGTHRVVAVGRREFGVFNIGGRFYALPNLCPHQAGPLCRAEGTTGTLEIELNEDGTRSFSWAHEGEIIRCPWHGLEFHVPTGRCLALPRLSVRAYEVVAEGARLVLRAGSSS